MLRFHCLQLWWNLSVPAMEEELHERPLYLRFVGRQGARRLPDETTINTGLATKGLPLKKGTVVHVTLIAAPSSTTGYADQVPDFSDLTCCICATRDLQVKVGRIWRLGRAPCRCRYR